MSAAITSTLRMSSRAYRSWNFRLKFETNRCRTVRFSVLPMYRTPRVAGCRYAYKQPDQRHGPRPGVWGSARCQCSMTFAPAVDVDARGRMGAFGAGVSIEILGGVAGSGTRDRP